MASKKCVAVCARQGCKFSYTYTFDDKIIHDRTCPRCGAEVLRSCPHCKKILMSEKGQTLCTQCAKTLKQVPPLDQKTSRGKRQDV